MSDDITVGSMEELLRKLLYDPAFTRGIHTGMQPDTRVDGWFTDELEREVRAIIDDDTAADTTTDAKGPAEIREKLLELDHWWGDPVERDRCCMPTDRGMILALCWALGMTLGEWDQSQRPRTDND